MKKWEVSGIASAGYAVAPVFVIRKEEIKAEERLIRTEEAEQEISRYARAVEQVQQELLKYAAENEIFAAHYALAGDVMLRDEVITKITEEHQNAEAALVKAGEKFANLLETMDDEYMRERAADMQDVTNQLLCALKGKKGNPFDLPKEKSILIARSLEPSDLTQIDFRLAAGLVTEKGGVTGHVAIIARNHGIPYLTGVEKLCDEAENGRMAVLDAKDGNFYLEPDAEFMELYREKAEYMAMSRQNLEQVSALPSETMDGYHFQICANAGSVAEIRQAMHYHMDGVGLFRSEFLYMECDHFPTEEEQLQVYAEAAALLQGKELTIRTLDIGGDKGLSYYSFPKEENPFLGYRAIRMCLNEKEIFKTQLRAILRAGSCGAVRMMFPMINSTEEICEIKSILDECKKELEEEQLAFDQDMQIGIMIETPAAVWMAEEFAEMVDFFSIGTNDLTQYILAVDRGNERIASKYDPFHPAVLRAISYTIRAAHRHQKKVGMCGELAGDERAAGLLLGLGLDEFSVSVGRSLELKDMLRRASYEERKQAAEEALHKSTAEQIKKM